MTWQHFQQLRQTAQSEIQKQLGLLQPRAGSGVAINGNQISLDEREPEEAPPAHIPISIYVSMEGYQEGFHDGSQETYYRHEFSFPLELAVTTLPSGNLERHNYYWQHLQVLDSKGDDYQDIRQGTITFVQKPFRFPVVLHLEQKDWRYVVKATDTVVMQTDTVFYQARALKSGEFLEFYIARISKL